MLEKMVSILILSFKVAALDKILKKMRESPKNVRFADLEKVCRAYFGEPRQRGTSHQVYKTPWAGDPRVNIQEGDSGKAKAYQVRQVLDAIEKLETERKKKGSEEKDNPNED